MNRSLYTLHLLKTFLKKKYGKQPKSIHIKGLIPSYSLLWYFTKQNKSDSNITTVNGIINEADKLFEDEKYDEVYNLLSSYNKSKEVDIDWRICRALYKMSKTNNYNEETKQAMILEAYGIISETIKTEEKNADVQKWMAILLDAKLRYEKWFSQMKHNIRIKNHLHEANKLNPNDFSVLYMLGQWHYKLCTLNWFEKKIASLFENDVPTCKYEDALIYFSKAEHLKPRCYLCNTYMLGKVNYHMGNMYRAHYYLNIAAHMTPNSDQEDECLHSARVLVSLLKKYDVSENAFFYLFWLDI